MPKCVVASEAALKMVPPLADTGAAKYTPYHGNVCDNSKFNVPYVQKFNLVLNALDNIPARRRVNRLCLAANVPLVEAGTAGYLGQVTVIDKSSNTECYECQPKPTQKVYPICTIRSTPSQPVHCIVWAKELYKLCFGPKVGDSMLFEDEESLRAEKAAEEAEEEKKENEEGGNVNGNENNNGSAAVATAEAAATDGEESGEKSTYMDLIVGLRLLLGVDTVSDEKKVLDLGDDAKRNEVLSKAQESLTALFVTEIEKQIGMDRYKTADKVPVPVSLDDLAKCSTTITGDGGEQHLLPPTERKDYEPTQIWSPSDCIQELASCFLDVATSTNQPLPEFDKDDDMAMRFVTAASNLRSYVFQIDPIQSLYSAKGIAGNIIPAIATTNAIVAGLQVLQCFHILKAQLNSVSSNNNSAAGNDGAVDETCNLKKTCRYTYCLRDKTRKGYYLQPTTLPDPNPNCFVCRNAIISLALNTQEWTLDMLLSRVIKKELGFHEPTILVGGDIVYEEGEDIDPSEYAINLNKKLVNLPSGGVTHGSVIRIEDYSQDLEVDVNVSHKDRWMIKADDDSGVEKVDDREEIEKFEIGGKKPVASATTTADGAKDDMAQDPAAAKDDDDDVEIIDDDNTSTKVTATAAASSNGKKRKPETEEDGNKAKKTKVDTDEVIE